MTNDKPLPLDEALATIRRITERRQADTVEPFEALVGRMRRAQTQYFRTRSQVDLIEARRLEKLVDTWIRNKDGQDGQGQDRL